MPTLDQFLTGDSVGFLTIFYPSLHPSSEVSWNSAQTQFSVLFSGVSFLGVRGRHLSGRDPCSGVRSAYLRAGRWQRWSLVENERKEQHKNTKASKSKKRDLTQVARSLLVWVSRLILFCQLWIALIGSHSPVSSSSLSRGITHCFSPSILSGLAFLFLFWLGSAIDHSAHTHYYPFSIVRQQFFFSSNTSSLIALHASTTLWCPCR